MRTILCIDTALETATICLSIDGNLIDADQNTEFKDHATWLHKAIDGLLKKNGLALPGLDAIAVSIGPGSYTGLRVGLSAAKGLCYALKIPLLSINTLEIIALGARAEAQDLICPMIDARRMEVYTAVYDLNLIEIISPLAMILHTNSFESLLANHHLLFCGNGINKFRPLVKSKKADFTEMSNTTLAMSSLADMYLQKEKKSDIAYCEPLYLKDFQSSTTRQ